ncbi:hypothetical protein [Sunxiuqinia sp. sy24]|uniref:hypothetical protein n=1 Tax=Sunxiuqinia sp. sy24 TaxID=3461495 RepID=UPI004045C411
MPDKLEFKIVNSNSFYIIKIIGVSIGIIGILLGGAVLARGTNGNFISLFIQLPFWLELTLGITSFILIGISVIMQFNKNSEKGLFTVGENSLCVDNKDITLKQKVIIIQTNALKNKPIYKRDFLEGSNNWLKIRENDKSIFDVEFLIDSKEKEDGLLTLIDQWKETNQITFQKSKSNFWQKWNEF